MDDRARGLMLGLAIGDALGAPAEFLGREQILERFGPQGIQDFVKGRGMFTDDTQMSIAVAEALLEAGRGPLDGLMQAVARRFVEWHDSPDNFRSPGISTKIACAKLKDGKSWRESGGRVSKGCGSVMRTAPVGYYYRDSPERLKEAAHAIGAATHPHPTADAACLAASWAVKLALADAPLGEWLPGLRALTRGLCEEFSATLGRVEAALALADQDKAILSIGKCFHGWTADEVLGIALYSVLRHPDDFRACVLLAINNSGDSDSIGCVAGALQGARLGASRIPAAWAEGIERRADLEALADRLAEAAGAA